VVEENTDTRVRDWSNYSWLSFFLYVDSRGAANVRAFKVKLQEYRHGSSDGMGGVVDLERAVYEVSLRDVMLAGYGPLGFSGYSGWQHWLVPLPWAPGSPVAWTSVATNPDGTDTYDWDGVFTNDSVRALIFEKDGDPNVTMVIDEVVLTNACTAEIARIHPGRGNARLAGLCEAAIAAAPGNQPTPGMVDVVLRTTNPLALLTTFNAMLVTGPDGWPVGEPLVDAPQYHSEIAINLWDQSTNQWAQPRTLQWRWAFGTDPPVERRRGYAIHPSNLDWRYIFLTDRREFDLATLELTTDDPHYLAGQYWGQDRVALTLFILPKGEDAAGDITVGQGECVDVLVLPQPTIAGRRWRRYVFGLGQ